MGGYLQGRQRMLGSLLLVAATLTGCGNPVATSVPDIQASWLLAENLVAEGDGKRCTSGGTLSLVQEGASVFGSYSRSVTCSQRSGSTAVAAAIESGSVEDGQVQGNTIRFRLGKCQYRGALTGTPPDRAGGSLLCLELNSTAAGLKVTKIAGNWTATRIVSGP